MKAIAILSVLIAQAIALPQLESRDTCAGVIIPCPIVTFPPPVGPLLSALCTRLVPGGGNLCCAGTPIPTLPLNCTIIAG
ncbi:hypothetical protein NMY22_g12255 [Coprinellus aureogranulatus]|nr:hypothetical protein NMY22_g12255 [Coprinellus aureogranulatus]